MDYPVYHDFLKKVAAEVDGIARTTQARDYFKKHIKQFIKMCNDCEAAAKKLADPEYDRQEQRYMELRLLGKSDIEEKPEPVKRYPTAEELPPHPTLWFCGYGLFADHPIYFGNILVAASNTRLPSTENEKLMCHFVRLAIIHDWICTSPTDTAIYFQDKDCPDAQIGGLIWQGLTDLISTDDFQGKTANGRNNEKRITEKALEEVKAILSKPLTIPDMIKALEQYKQVKDIWDFSALPPIGQLYDFLCRAKGQCGAKTTNIMNSIGGAAGNGSGYYPAMLQEFMSNEVLDDLRQWDKPQEENKYPNCSHNEDFTAVHWCGIDYTFNKTQGKCIKYLWKNGQAHEESIGEYIKTAAGKDYHLKDTFRNHDAWGEMIVKLDGIASKGLFALQYE